MEERIDVPVEELAEDIRLNVVDVEDFNARVVGAYNDGSAEKGLEADDAVARSIIPAAKAFTAVMVSFLMDLFSHRHTGSANRYSFVHTHQ